MPIRGDIALYIVRHQDTVALQRGLVQGGTSHGRLSPKGKKTAAKVADFLAEQGEFDALYHSDLRRAVQTTLPIRKKLKIPFVEPTPLLRERELGKLEGTTLKALRVRAPPDYLKLESKAGPLHGTDIEWLSSLETRARMLVNHILHQPHRRVMIVAHGAMNNYLINHLLGQRAGEPQLNQDHNEIYKLVIDRLGRVKSHEKLTAY